MNNIYKTKFKTQAEYFYDTCLKTNWNFSWKLDTITLFKIFKPLSKEEFLICYNEYIKLLPLLNCNGSVISSTSIDKEIVLIALVKGEFSISELKVDRLFLKELDLICKLKN